MVAALDLALREDDCTTEELDRRVAEACGPWAAEESMPVFGGFGRGRRQALRGAAVRGVLCFGPNQGQRVAYASPSWWLSDVVLPDPDQRAADTAARLSHGVRPGHAGAPGPVAGHVTGVDQGLVRPRDLDEVELGGGPAWVWRDDLTFEAGPPPVVRLLPYFDAFQVGSQPRGLLFPGRASERRWRVAGRQLPGAAARRGRRWGLAQSGPGRRSRSPSSRSVGSPRPSAPPWRSRRSGSGRSSRRRARLRSGRYRWGRTRSLCEMTDRQHHRPMSRGGLLRRDPRWTPARVSEGGSSPGGACWCAAPGGRDPERWRKPDPDTSPTRGSRPSRRCGLARLPGTRSRAACRGCSCCARGCTPTRLGRAGVRSRPPDRPGRAGRGRGQRPARAGGEDDVRGRGAARIAGSDFAACCSGLTAFGGSVATGGRSWTTPSEAGVCRGCWCWPSRRGRRTPGARARSGLTTRRWSMPDRKRLTGAVSAARAADIGTRGCHGPACSDHCNGGAR